MAPLLYSALIGLLAVQVCHCKLFNRPDMEKEDRQVIVMAAPSVWDSMYRDSFLDIIQFQVNVANAIRGHDNVVIVADKHTMPYLDGRAHQIKGRLPADALIQANLYDIHLRDYAPIGSRKTVKFGFTPRTMAVAASTQIDFSMTRFLQKNDITLDKLEPEMVLTGGDVVDNGVDKAVIDHRILDDNHGRVPDWAVMIKLFNTFKRVVMIDNPFNMTIGDGDEILRLADAIAFLDEKMIVFPTLDEETRAYLEGELYKKYRSEVMILDLPTNHTSDYNDFKNAGICGMYSSLLVTDRFVYVPAFGSDPSNWEHGHSTMTDKMIVHMLEVNTIKKVVPVSVPRAICKKGFGLRGLTWNAKGKAAEQLVELARWQGRQRFSRL